MAQIPYQWKRTITPLTLCMNVFAVVADLLGCGLVGLEKSELGVLVTVISPTIYPLASPHRPTYQVTPWKEVLCAKPSRWPGENTFGSAGCNINHIRDAIAEADKQFGVAVTERDGRDIVVNTDTFLQ